MNNKITAASYSIHSNKGAFALLLGSGISRNAGIPTGWEVTMSLIKQIAILNKADPGPFPDQWYEETFGRVPDYSEILEMLTNYPGERISVLRHFFEPSDEDLENGLKIPTTAHKQIARLVKDGYIKVIITTNFDRLLEMAFSELGIAPTVISNASHIDGAIPLIHSNITIIKINGDYLNTQFLNTRDELQSYNARLAEYLHFIFENFGLITCGWSARWDLALVDILKSANKFRYSNYYSHVGEVDPNLAGLRAFRNGSLIQIAGADEFFTEIKENIEALDRSQGQHPLTAPLILSKLKKYIATPEFEIHLSDLFQEVTEDCYRKINSISRGSLKVVLEQYFTDLELVSILMVNASYWAKRYHYTLLLKTIDRLFHKSPTNLLDDRLNKFPALVLRYACGIASVAKDNFELLQVICDHEIRKPTGGRIKKFRLTAETDQWDLIQAAELNQAMGTSDKMPHSEQLFSYLRPIFKDILPHDEDFKSAFHLYELITVISQMENNPDAGYPEGKYVMDRYERAFTMFSELLDLGEDSPLFTSGLFKPTQTLRSNLNQQINEAHRRNYR